MSRPLAITICSGGLDSSTLVYLMRERGYDQHLITFDYGQRHKKEITSARGIAAAIGATHSVIDISNIGKFLSGSSLTDATLSVPEGYYAAENMKQTVVPNRNAIMLSIAWGIATAEKAKSLAIGVHAGDHAIYPDCRVPFINTVEEAFKLGTEGHADPALIISTPYIESTKTDIVCDGLRMKVPFYLTWTCYKGGDKACGRCGSCIERLEAFDANGVEDPLVYADKKYWKEAVKTKQAVG